MSAYEDPYSDDGVKMTRIMIVMKILPFRGGRDANYSTQTIGGDIDNYTIDQNPTKRQKKKEDQRGKLRKGLV